MKRITYLLIFTLPLFCLAQNTNGAKEEQIGLSLQELLANGYISPEDLQSAKPPDNWQGAEKETCTDSYIPVDGTYTAVPRNDDGSLYIPNMGFTFSFCGTTYTDCFINTNGNISFTQGVTQYSPDGFPYNVPMVAPFWADVDTRNTACGQAWYKIVGNYMIVSWENVGWFSMQCSPLNTFQVIISDGTAPIIGVGNNIQFRYGDMNWTTGQASGGGPFGGFAATVGYNSGDNVNFEQIGRFSVDGFNYDGPFGSDDGVHWLDFQCFAFDAGVGTVSLSCLDIDRALDANCLLSITPEEVSDLDINGCAEAILSLDITDFDCDNLGPNTVTITADVGGTTQSCTAVVTINQGLCATPQIFDVGPFCDSETPITLSANPPGGTWGGSAPSGIFDPSVGQGIHTVTYTSPIACPSSTSLNIEVYDTPQITVTPDPTEYCEEDAFIEIFTNTTGGDGIYTFEWSTPNGPEFTPDILATSEGIYILTVTDGNNCQTVEDVVVIMNLTPLATIVDPGIICEDLSFFQMQGVPDGGTWFGPGIDPVGVVIPFDIGAGVFPITYSYTDDNGCTGETNFDLEISPLPLAIASNLGPYCQGNVIELFGETDYPGSVTWEWIGPAGFNSNEQSPTDATSEGLYTLQVFTPDGCMSEIATTIVEFVPAPDASASSTGPYCAGDLIELLGSTTSGGNIISYSWTGPNGYISSDQNPTDATDPGIYSLLVNVDGCESNPVTTEVEVNPAPDIIASNSGPYCLDDNIQLFGSTSASGNVITYSWTGPNGYISSQQNPTNATEPGDYSVMVTVDGCESPTELTVVTVNQATSPSITGDTDFCEGAAAVIDAGSGYINYNWSDGTTTQSNNVASGGLYTVTVTDANNCTAEASILVTENTNPVPVISGSATFCAGTSSLIDAGAGYTTYLWSTSESTQSITVTTTDVYSVTITDANGCTGEADFAVTENNALSPTITGDLDFCENENTLLNAGAGFETYNWSNGDTGPVTTVDATGTYTVTVTDDNGCTGETSVSVTENTLPMVNITGTASLCEGENTVLSTDGSFDTYQWSDNSSGPDITVDATGTYSVTVTNTSGCTDEASFAVTVNALPTLTISGPTSFCEGSNTLLDAGGGYASYDWSNGSTTQTIDVTQGGSYTVTVSDNNGCTAEEQVDITENPSLTPQITGILAFCEGETSNLDAGSGYDTYAWSTGDGGQTLSVDATGTYTVTVTDTNGCSGETSVSVTENTLPTVNITGTASLCEGDNTVLSTDGSFDTYQWSDNSSGPDITVDATGTYSVTVTDTNGCTDEASFAVTVNAPPTLTISGPTSFCEGSNTLLDAGGGYASYDWSNGGTTQIIDVTQGGSYTVIVTDNNGCTAEEQVDITENPFLNPQITGILVFCEGETSTLDAGSGYDTYAWNTGDGGQTLSVDSTGSYTVTVTDDNGCTGETSVSVTENTLPVVNITGTASFCEGDNTVLSTDGSFDTYQWSDNSSGPDITVDATGTYSVTVTDTNGCTDEASFAVTVNAPPTLTISGPTSFCEGSNALLDAGGGYANYDWSNGGTFQTIDVMQGGSYTVTVTDNNGCTAEEQVDITENPSLTPQISGILAFCEGETSTLDVGGGYDTYAWSTGNGGQTLLVDATGTYTVTVTDTNGCTGETSVSVNENNLPTVNITGTASLCEGENTVLSTDGTFDTYQWSDNSSGTDITVDATGTYSVTVTDTNGCTAEAAFNVALNPNPEPVIAGSTTFCSGSSTNLDVGSGYAEYLWSDGSGGQVVTITAANTYSVTVTDDNGCTGVASTEVMESSSLEPVISGDLAYCEGTNTLLNAGAGFDSYIWSDGSEEQTLEVNAAGVYGVTVSDSQGCTGETSVEVMENSLPNLTISGNQPFCTGENIMLDAGNGYTDYLWSDLSLNQTLSVVTGGDYSVTVTDASGCTAEESITVVENPNPDPMIVGLSTFCTGSEVTLELDDTYDAYEWSNGSVDQNILVNTGGTYSVTVSSAAGCTGEAQLTVTENDNLEPTITGELAFCEGGSTTLTAPPGLIYEWSNNMTTQSIEVTNTGTYTVLVSDADGCTGTGEVSVVENDLPTPAIAGSNTFCIGNSTIIDAGAGYETYSWSDGSSGQTLEVSVQGSYEVTVTDNNGCTGVAQLMVSESASLNPVISGDLQLCEGEISSLDAGSGFQTYLWSTGETTQMINTDQPGDYSVVVSDASGCTGEGTVSLMVNNNPVATITGQDNICEGEVATLDAGGGYAEYLWTNGSVDQLLEVTATGNYSVTVTDANGCTAEASMMVTQNTLPVVDIEGPTSFCSGNTATLTVSGNYDNYIWSTGETTSGIVLTTGADVSVTVTDANGCTAEAALSITENTELTPVIDGQLAFCEGNTSTLNAGAGWATYEWSTGETTPTITVSDGGNYGVIVTDQDGCSGSTNVTVDLNQNPAPIIAGSTTFCTGSSTTLDAGSYETYIWSTGSTDPSITTDQPGNYTVTVTDINGCTGEAAISVDESSSLNPVISGLPAFCENESTTLDVGSGFETYMWSTGAASQTLEVSQSGDYSVTVSDASGCTGETSIAVDLVLPPEANVEENTSICNTELSGSMLDLYDLVISGDMTGTWEDLDGSGASGLFDNLNFDGVAPGNYNFMYTTNSAVAPCPEVSYPVVITVEDCACNSVVFFSPDPICNSSGSLDLTTVVSTNEPGIWSITTAPVGTNPASLTGSLFDATGADAGEYILAFELTGPQPPNCPDLFTQFIIVDQEVSAGTPGAPFAVCADESSLVLLADMIDGEDANGVWTETSAIPSTGSAFDASLGSFNTLGQGPGIYTFQYEVFGATTCPDQSVEVMIEINELPTAIAGQGFELDCSDPTGSLDAGGSSFGSDFDIVWTGPGVVLDGNENTLTPTIEAGGDYQLVITNMLTGCSASDLVTVTESSDLPVALAGVDQEITCDVGTAILQPGENYGPEYLIVWSGPGITAANMNELNPEVTIPGSYTLTVTLIATGCSSSPDAVEVIDNTADPDLVIVTPLSAIDCAISTVDLTGTSAVANASFEWTDANSMVLGTGAVLTGVDEEGIYFLTVTDPATGCTATESAEVVNNVSFPFADAGTPQLLDCVNNTVTLDGSGSDSGQDIVYEWNGQGASGTDATLDVSLPGTYTLVVTDNSNGCTSAATVVVDQDLDAPVASIASPDELTCGTTSVALVGSATGATDYQWLDAGLNLLGTEQETTVGEVGQYYFIAINADNGCVDTAVVAVAQNEDMPQTALIETQDPYCTGESSGYVAIGAVTGGTVPYLYSVDGVELSADNFYTGLGAGTYDLLIEDANGCTWDTTVQIIDPPVLTLNLGADLDLVIGDSAVIHANITPANRPIDTIYWMPSSLVRCDNTNCTTVTLNTINTTMVFATIVDENGCEAKDDVLLRVDRERPVFIPSAFSPNDDDNNDLFMIYGDDSRVVKVNYFQIFNRWGEIVFEGTNFAPNDETVAWDGRFRGELMNPAVFVYIAEIEFTDGEVEMFYGDVTLLK